MYRRLWTRCVAGRKGRAYPFYVPIPGDGQRRQDL